MSSRGQGTETEVIVPNVTHATMTKAAAFCSEAEPSAAAILSTCSTLELCKLMKLANYLEIKPLLTATSEHLGGVGVELLARVPTDPVIGLFGEDALSADRESFTAVMRELGAYEPGLVAMIKMAMVGTDLTGVTALRAFENFAGKPVGLQILATKQAMGDVKIAATSVVSVNGMPPMFIPQTNREIAANEVGGNQNNVCVYELRQRF